MKRLLCVVGSMNAGGAETFLMKIFRTIDKTKYQIDFAVSSSEPNFYDDEIRALGGKIFYITAKTENPWKSFWDIKNLVKRERYRYVLKTTKHSLAALDLLAALWGGAKIRVYRSTNSSLDAPKKMAIFLHYFCRFMPKYFANVRLAPSTEAAEFMFGKGCVKKKKATILANAVDLSVLAYNEQARKEVRDELRIAPNAFVLGHIGRFAEQKNHEFLIDIFKRVREKNKNARLLLVGEGGLREQIEEKTVNLGIRDSVIFAGVRSDISAVLSAMDVFVLPSFYEGLPNTVIEAQATGLPCVIADTITREANITGLVKYLPFSTIDEWTQEILRREGESRIDAHVMFKRQGYDIQSSADKFVQLVFEK